MAAEEGQVIAIHSVEKWEEHIQKAKDSKKLVVVDFTASWCGPCRFIAPVLADIAKKTPEVLFLKVDVDEMRALAEKYSVEAMPTFLFLIEGKQVEKFAGANKAKLELTIAQHAAAAAATTATTAAATATA